MTNILEVNNLNIAVSEGRKVVKNVNFELKKGEILGIVGESGSGKSLTALSVLGLFPHLAGTSLKISEQEMSDKTEEEWRLVRGNKIGFIFQEPMSSLNPLHPIGKQIAETIILHQNLTFQKALTEASRLLDLVGVEKRLNAYPFELSGGQRQRVMIAMAVANNPEILVADEPTTALDVTVQEQIISLLLDLRKKLNMSVIFISHDLSVIKKIADRVIVMKDGEIVEHGDTEQIFAQPKNNYTKTLVNSFNSMKKNKKNNGDVLLEAKNIKVSFPLKKNFLGKVKEELNAVNDVSFIIRQGETLGVVGESGSGKSTLGLSLVGLNKYIGDISYCNKPITSYKSRDISKEIQIVFQDPYNSLNPRMNVEDIVSEGLMVNYPNMKREERKNRVLSALNEVGLSYEDMQKYPHQFSGGQRQRIAIARALVLEPKLLILDEPTSALDVTIQAQVIKLLQHIQNKRNISYIFISHDMKAIRAMSDDIIVMKNGKIVEQGTAKDIFNSPQQDYTKQLISAAL